MCKNRKLIIGLLFCGLTCVLVLSGCSGGGGNGNEVGNTPSSTQLPQTPEPGMTYAWPNGASEPWFMPSPPSTDISPLPGLYTFTPKDSTGLDYGHRETIRVVEESDKKYVEFASDGWRFDRTEIINGAFYIEWGLGPGSWPTDAYAISGCFTSETRAEGLYKYAGSSKTITGQTTFIATIKQ